VNARLSVSALLELVEAETLRRAAENSLYEFVKQSWHVVEPGVPFIPSWHIEAICEHLEAVTHGDIRRLLINIPPRHSKSTIVSVMWPAWEWITDPQQKFLCASYSGALSTRDNLKTRRLIQSPWYSSRWGHMFAFAGDQNAKQRFENDKTGYRLATSVGGTATGEGGSRLILDDPHGAQDAQSEAMRNAALEWFDVVWSTRLNNPKTDAMVTIMQRLHEKDISGHIIDDIKGWEHICIPAEWDGEKRVSSLGSYDPRKVKGELICPERFGEAEIITLKQLLGEYGTAGQLQQNPVPTKGGILKTKHLQMWPTTEPTPQLEFVVQSYDTAFTEETTGDPSACTVWGIFTHKKQRNAMLLDAWDEHLGYPELRAKVMEEWCAEYGGSGSKGHAGPATKPRRPDRVLVEKKASGQSLIQDLRRAKVPVVAFNPGTSDKVARAHQAAPILELGLLWIPESKKNPGQLVSWAQPLIKQMAKFPVAEHDDLVDTTTQCVIFLRNEGLLAMPTASREELPKEAPNTPRANPYAV
jgi:predicted phage terminase large subunit-like protein